MKMYQHDTVPDLEDTLSGTVGGVTGPIDLTGAQVVKVIGVQGGAQLFARTVTGDAQGRVVMPWDAADTAVLGPISIEYEVTWSAGRVQTFRAQPVIVVADLG